MGEGGGEGVFPPRACQAGPSEGAVSWGRCHQSGGSRKQHPPWPRPTATLRGAPPGDPRGGRLRPQEEGGEGGAYNPPPRPQGPSFWASPRKDVSSPLSRVLLCWVWTDLPSAARCGLSGRAVLGPVGRGWVSLAGGGALLLGADVSLTTWRGLGALHALQVLSRGLHAQGFCCLLGTPGCAEIRNSQACVETLGAGSLGVGRQSPPPRGAGRQTPPLLPF